MPRVTAVVFDSHDNSLVMQFNNSGIRRYRNVSEVEFLRLSRTVTMTVLKMSLFVHKQL